MIFFKKCALFSLDYDGSEQAQPRKNVYTIRLVPVQITIPAQQGNPQSQPRALTVQVKTSSESQSHLIIDKY